jgi:hypothetical protein
MQQYCSLYCNIKTRIASRRTNQSAAPKGAASGPAPKIRQNGFKGQGAALFQELLGKKAAGRKLRGYAITFSLAAPQAAEKVSRFAEAARPGAS